MVFDWLESCWGEWNEHYLSVYSEEPCCEHDDDEILMINKGLVQITNAFQCQTTNPTFQWCQEVASPRRRGGTVDAQGLGEAQDRSSVEREKQIRPRGRSRCRETQKRYPFLQEIYWAEAAHNEDGENSTPRPWDTKLDARRDRRELTYARERQMPDPRERQTQTQEGSRCLWWCMNSRRHGRSTVMVSQHGHCNTSIFPKYW